ncbi:MAG TPA: hypothetical protein VGP63_24155 [Planctomycetaceae bacterium]|nr:hypothetical protein [Planctomycetaceae bacterium]
MQWRKVSLPKASNPILAVLTSTRSLISSMVVLSALQLIPG